MSRPTLEIRDLHKSYGDIHALDGIHLDLERGEVLGLLGPNGAGKTTLVSIIGGLLRADRGRVMVDGIDVASDPQRARASIGLAPQETGIYPMVKVVHNLQLFGELAGLSGPRLRGEIDRVADLMGLSRLLDRKAGELSGGQKRRLHTGIALLAEPPLVLLDEATTGADVETRAGLIEAVKDLGRRGTSVVYSTHYLHEVETMDARVVLLDQGSVLAAGSVPDLISSRGTPVVEMTFDGPPPESLGALGDFVTDSTLRMDAKDPPHVIAEVLRLLGPAASCVLGIEILKPSLETVYLTLTGHRYAEDDRDEVAA